MAKSVMTHNFSGAPQANIERSRFDRSHGYKTSFDSGLLVPFLVDEVLPGDTFNLRSHIFSRLATPLTPIMDNLFLDTFYFFVPNRLVWDNWQLFMGEDKHPNDPTSPKPDSVSVPQVELPAVEIGSLADYFGLPTGVTGLSVNALPFRAYNLIYNEWFRDENLIDYIPDNHGDGPDSYGDYTLRRRGKRHDYFTSCLPWPQKGPGVEIPIGGQAPIEFLSTPTFKAGATRPDGSINLTLIDGGSGRNNTAWLRNASVMSPGGPDVNAQLSDYNFGANTPASTNWQYYDGITTDSTLFGGYADLDNALSSGTTINQLREAFQLQRMQEKDARGGTRYTEIIRSHFGVISPDSRLQRPEFLGGSSERINFNSVPQTSESGSTPQGNLASFAVGLNSSGKVGKSFVEHGFIIGLLSVRADLTYQQGIDKFWSRNDRIEYYWPTLAHLGEQAVLNKEIFAQGTPDDDNVFGYQERYAEYRYKPSHITGVMRSSAPQSLDVWHLSQDFDSLPALNQDFIEENPPVDRIIAVQDEPQFIADVYIDMQCFRPMPVYGIPGMMDHF